MWMWYAEILYHLDDDVDLLYHCNIIIFLFIVSVFSGFKGHILQGTPFTDCFQIYFNEYGKQYLAV